MWSTNLDFVYEPVLKSKPVCKYCSQQYLDLTLFMSLHWKISKLQTLWSTISRLDFVYEPTLKNNTTTWLWFPFFTSSKKNKVFCKNVSFFFFVCFCFLLRLLNQIDCGKVLTNIWMVKSLGEKLVGGRSSDANLLNNFFPPFSRKVYKLAVALN